MILCAASYICSSAEMLTLYFCSSQNTSARVNIITVIEISLHLFYTFCRWLHLFKRCNFTPLKVLFLWQEFYTFLGVNLHPWKIRVNLIGGDREQLPDWDQPKFWFQDPVSNPISEETRKKTETRRQAEEAQGEKTERQEDPEEVSDIRPRLFRKVTRKAKVRTESKNTNIQKTICSREPRIENYLHHVGEGEYSDYFCSQHCGCDRIPKRDNCLVKRHHFHYRNPQNKIQWCCLKEPISSEKLSPDFVALRRPIEEINRMLEWTYFKPTSILGTILLVDCKFRTPAVFAAVAEFVISKRVSPSSAVYPKLVIRLQGIIVPAKSSSNSSEYQPCLLNLFYLVLKSLDLCRFLQRSHIFPTERHRKVLLFSKLGTFLAVCHCHHVSSTTGYSSQNLNFGNFYSNLLCITAGT